MARAIRRIDIFVPLDSNDGRPIEDAKCVSLQRELLQRFGGVTSIQRQFPRKGYGNTSTHCTRIGSWYSR
jgi:hypothetical protein